MFSLLIKSNPIRVCFDRQKYLEWKWNVTFGHMKNDAADDVTENIVLHDYLHIGLCVDDFWAGRNNRICTRK